MATSTLLTSPASRRGTSRPSRSPRRTTSSESCVPRAPNRAPMRRSRSWSSRPCGTRKGRSSLLDEARHPPVCEGATLCLTGWAVRDLIALVGHAAQVGSAPGAGMAVAPVDLEALSELRRKPTSPLALAREGLVEHGAHGVHELGATFPRQRGQRLVRREPRSPEDVVGEAAPDSGDGSLVPQEGV